MIISEKQIMQLIHFCYEYRKLMLEIDQDNMLSSKGKVALEQMCDVLGAIINQQPQELKIIE